MISVKHPKTLWILAFSSLWDTFSYFGTQTILVLYLLNIFHMQRNVSYLIYGAYAAMAFSSPIIGGIIADKWLGSKKTLIFGCILNITGNLILMSFNRYLFSLGLATTLIGSGLYKSNSSHLIGTLYKDGEFRKESGFTWYYLAINVGGTLGPLVYGFVIYSIGWNYGFLCSALGILIGTLLLLKKWRLIDIKDKTLANSTFFKKILIYSTIILSCFLLSLPFYTYTLINPLVWTIFIFSIIYLLIMISRYKEKKRKRLFALLILCFFAMFYFAAGLQIGTTITLFIQSKIDKNIIHTNLPASTFSMLYPFFVLLLAPLFTIMWAKLRKKGIILKAPSKLVIGIALATLGIAFFALASATNYILGSIVVGYLFLSAGELALTPAAYTALSDLSPRGMKSTMMGCWLLFIAIGGYFSSILANTSHFIAGKLLFIHTEYLAEFLFIAIFTILIVIISAILSPKLVSMMK